ncbi:RNA 3'-terminal phosphate cyclase [Escherichia albertii]|uniref:RNA 3'-terminal phosphate cyclase n=1 Tax=Escherichia albertii TaxID=208962 RepID=UPI003F6BACEA
MRGGDYRFAIGSAGSCTLVLQTVLPAQLVKEVKRYLASPAAVGEYLADQIVLSMALAGAGEFTVAHPSCHLLTNIAVLERFLPVRFCLIETDGITRVSIE